MASAPENDCPVPPSYSTQRSRSESCWCPSPPLASDDEGTSSRSFQLLGAKRTARQRSGSVGDASSLERRASKLTAELRRAIAHSNTAGLGPTRTKTQDSRAASAMAGAGDDADARAGSGQDEIDGISSLPSQAAGLAAQIDDMVLLCSICLECYKEPKVLPCQHTFCRECLETVLNSQKGTTSLLLCPECRLEVTLPKTGVQGLTTNFLISKLVDLLQTYRKDDEPSAARVTCDICHDDGDDEDEVDGAFETVAVVKCVECNKHLCDLHHMAHSRAKVTRSHATTPLDEGGKKPVVNSLTGQLALARQPKVSAKSPSQSAASDMDAAQAPLPSCDPLDHDVTETWCTSCRQFVCPDCSAPRHRSHGHRVSSVSTAFLEQKTSLEEKYSRLNTLAGSVESGIGMLDECQVALEAESERVMLAVHSCFQRLIDNFAARRSHLMDEIAQDKTARCKTLRLQREHLLYQVGNMHSGVQAIVEMMAGTDEAALLKASAALEKRAKVLLECEMELSPQTCPGMSFDSSWEGVFVESLQQLGRVDYSHVSPALCTACGSGLEPTMARGRDAVVDILVVDSHGEPSDHQSDQVTVVVYPPSALQAHSPARPGSGRPFSQISTAVSGATASAAISSPLATPELGMVASALSQSRPPPPRSGGQHLVATKNPEMVKKGHYCCVYVPKEEGEYLVEICVNGWPIKNSPFVAKVAPGRDYTSISGDGVSFGKEGSDEGQFKSPHGIAVDNQDLVIVADMVNNRMQMFNAYGGYLREFGNRGPNPGQFVDPMGVTVDDDGHVVVADYGNHRIQVLRHNGQCVRSFGGRGTAAGKFSLPFDVAHFCHPTIGLCYVITEFDNNRVQVVQSDGMPIYMFGSKGSGPGQFKNPAGVAVSDDYLIFVADHNNHRVQVFTVNGDFQRIFGRKGHGVGEMEHPCGVALDRLGNVLVSEFTNNRVQVFAPETYQAVATLGSETNLKFPTGVAIDKSGAVYVCSEHKVTVF